MKINIESTTKIVSINGIPSRVWEGKTETGVKVNCFVSLICIDKDEKRIKDFSSELKQLKEPSFFVEELPPIIFLD
jgi:hypothetical protein